MPATHFLPRSQALSGHGNASIIICDLREFHPELRQLAARDVIDLRLAISTRCRGRLATWRRILKFIGDGPALHLSAEQPSAGANLLHAVAEAGQPCRL